MALNAYLRLHAKSQGEIKGSVTQKGREGSIMVIAVDHEIFQHQGGDQDSAGKPDQKPITITKEVDRSTPALINAYVNQEKITKWELEFWQPSASGKEEQFFTIQLSDALIVGIHLEMLNNKYPENMQHKEREHVSFTYRTIVWEYEDGGMTAEDVWH